MNRNEFSSHITSSEIFCLWCAILSLQKTQYKIVCSSLHVQQPTEAEPKNKHEMKKVKQTNKQTKALAKPVALMFPEHKFSVQVNTTRLYITATSPFAIFNHLFFFQVEEKKKNTPQLTYHQTIFSRTRQHQLWWSWSCLLGTDRWERWLSAQPACGWRSETAWWGFAWTAGQETQDRRTSGAFKCLQCLDAWFSHNIII